MHRKSGLKKARVICCDAKTVQQSIDVHLSPPDLPPVDRVKRIRAVCFDHVYDFVDRFCPGVPSSRSVKIEVGNRDVKIHGHFSASLPCDLLILVQEFRYIALD